MPRHLLRILGVNALGGALAAVVLVAGLVAFDAHGLGSLVTRSDAPLVALALLTAGFVVTMASVAMGAAVMLLPSPDAGPAAGPRAGELIPVRVAARSRRHR